MVTAERNGLAERGLSDFLDARARNASDARIAIDIAVGSVAFVVAKGLRPEWWGLLASAGIVLFAFGAWAALGRVLEAGTHGRVVDSLLKILRSIIGWLGVAATLGTGFQLWTMMMGTWIS
jgi:hypothetical protein